MLSDDEQKIVDDAVSKLRDHFDSVRIFVTRHDGGEEAETVAYDTGSGNFYAQLGQIREWTDLQVDRATRNDEDDE